MKEIDHKTYIQYIPETEKDVEELKNQYPHLWPFESVCVAK